MHEAAHQFVRRVVAEHGPFPTVIEVGGRDINGSIREVFGAAEYTSIDLVDGPGVDVVADALDWQPPAPVACVVCCEVLEHHPDVPTMLARMASWLADDGWLIITCAGPGRVAHSAIDGEWLRDGEHYANVEPHVLADLLAGGDQEPGTEPEYPGLGFDIVELATPPTDLQVIAHRHGEIGMAGLIANRVPAPARPAPYSGPEQVPVA